MATVIALAVLMIFGAIAMIIACSAKEPVSLYPKSYDSGEAYYTPDPFRIKMYVMRKWTNQPCDVDAYVRGIVFKTWREARDMCVKMTEFARREHRK